MKQFKKYALPELDELLAQYTPGGILAARKFRQLVAEVMIEGGKGESDEKLKTLQQQYGPTKKDSNQYWQWIFLTCDLVGEYRRAIGVTGYPSRPIKKTA